MTRSRLARRRRRLPTWLLILVAVVCLAVVLWLLAEVGLRGHAFAARTTASFFGRLLTMRSTRG